MKSSDLNQLLKGTSSGGYLQSIINEEVLSYESLLKKKGSSIPLIFHEDEDIMLDAMSVNKLLQEVITGKLSNVHLAYICDCLTLGERVDFANEKLKDLIFELADPEINGGYKSNPELKEMLDDYNGR